MGKVDLDQLSEQADSARELAIEYPYLNTAAREADESKREPEQSRTLKRRTALFFHDSEYLYKSKFCNCVNTFR